MLEKMERVSTAKPTAVRRTRSKAEKRRIVEETQREGASVRSVARAYDIPANQLFHWRKLYREGLLGTEAEAAAGSGLVAVQIIGEQQPNFKQEKQSQGDPLVSRSSVGTILSLPAHRFPKLSIISIVKTSLARMESTAV